MVVILYISAFMTYEKQKGQIIVCYVPSTSTKSDCITPSLSFLVIVIVACLLMQKEQCKISSTQTWSQKRLLVIPRVSAKFTGEMTWPVCPTVQLAQRQAWNKQKRCISSCIVRHACQQGHGRALGREARWKNWRQCYEKRLNFKLVNMHCIFCLFFSIIYQNFAI